MGLAPSEPVCEKEVEIESQALYEQFQKLQSVLLKLSHPCLLKYDSCDLSDWDGDFSALSISTRVMDPGSLHGIVHFHATQDIRHEAETATSPLIILYGVALGLQYLHSKGLAHRGISLTNILIDDEFYPILTDYCLLLNTALKYDTYHTQPHKCFFLAPEELEIGLAGEGSLANALPADMYSFGMLMFVLLKQEFPDIQDFRLTHVTTVVAPSVGDRYARAVLDGARPDISDEDVFPPNVGTFLTRCFSGDPAARPTIDEAVTLISSKPKDLGFGDISMKVFSQYQKHVQGTAPAGRAPAVVTKEGFLRGLADDSAEANFFLGQMYETGDGVARNLEESVKFYRKSAELGSQFGSLRYAMMLHFGHGTEVNINEAIRFYEAAAKNGNSDALNNLAGLIEAKQHGGGPGLAVDYYRKSAIAGNPSGRANYSRLLQFGQLGVGKDVSLSRVFGGGRGGSDSISHGVSRVEANDYAEAARLFGDAARRGDVTATYNLGWMAENGLAEGSAEALYRQAADGSVEALNNLGVLLVKSGRKDEGYSCIKKAAEGGSPHAKNNLGVAIEQGEVKAGPLIAPTLYKEAADAGLADALQNLAAALEVGNGIKQNKERALEFYRKAVEASGGRLAESVRAIERLS
jgi:TPR repeat protein